MGECLNCGSHVTDRYVRVKSLNDAPPGKVKVCPHCEDIIRDSDGTTREARSRRRANQ